MIEMFPAWKFSFNQKEETRLYFPTKSCEKVRSYGESKGGAWNKELGEFFGDMGSLAHGHLGQDSIAKPGWTSRLEPVLDKQAGACLVPHRFDGR
jgi:hypothetical protein